MLGVGPERPPVRKRLTFSDCLENASEEKQDDAEGDYTVNAYEVSGEVDYDKLIKDWGCDPLTPEQIARFEKLTGKRAHPMIRRGMYYAHR